MIKASWIFLLIGLMSTPIWADEQPSQPTPEAWQALREQNASLQQQVATLSQQVVQLQQSLAEVQTIDPSQLSKEMNQKGFLSFLSSGLGWLLLLGIALIVAAVAALIWLLVPRSKPVSELVPPEKPKHFPPDPAGFAEDPLRPEMEDSAFNEDLLADVEEEEENESESEFAFDDDLLLDSNEDEEQEEDDDESLLEEAEEATELDLDDDLVESEEEFADKAMAFSAHDTNEDDEFDFMNSPDAMPVRLDLARAYLEMADLDAVRETLQLVLEKGTAEQQAEAKDIILQAEAADQK